VVEWGWTDLTFDTDTKTAKIGTPSSILFCPANGMTPGASAVNHLTMRHLAGHPLHTDEHVTTLIKDGEPQFIVAHYWEMEGQWITPELLAGVHNICTLKCAAQIWPEAPSFGNSALRYWLEMDLDERWAMPAHRAAPDTFVTAHILAKMLETERVANLVNWTRMPRHYPLCTLAKYKGRPWSDCDHGYLVWITTKAEDMDPDIKAAAQSEIDRRRNP
jgi:exodeoxyribonuclease X